MFTRAGELGIRIDNQTFTIHIGYLESMMCHDSAFLGKSFDVFGFFGQE